MFNFHGSDKGPYTPHKNGKKQDIKVNFNSPEKARNFAD